MNQCVALSFEKRWVYLPELEKQARGHGSYPSLLSWLRIFVRKFEIEKGRRILMLKGFPTGHQVAY